MRSKMWKAYLKMEKLLIPRMINPQLAYREELCNCINKDTRWLDLGCGHRFFSNTLPDSETLQSTLVNTANCVVGIDGDFDALKLNNKIHHKIVGDIQKLPFKDDSFNLITANMVVEHVSDPFILLGEINRILTNNGILIIHTPNTQNYKIMLARAFPESLKKPMIKYLQNRGGGDVYPTFYRMNSPIVMKKNAQHAGFQIKKIHLVQGPADSVMLGPLVIFELLWMKMLSYSGMNKFRSNMIVLLHR